MKLYPIFYSLILAIILVSCTSPDITQKTQPDINRSTQSQVVNLENIKVAIGQTLYVPIYSHIYHEDGRKIFYLAATLSFRNTDLTHPIILTSVRYYDSNGKLVKQYLNNPIQLGSMASTDFVVNRTDTSGGLGANFIVEWVAETEISEPVVEAVMIGTDSNQGISFISPGRVIKRQNNLKRQSPVKGS